jgi:hypothetical protein
MPIMIKTVTMHMSSIVNPTVPAAPIDTLIVPLAEQSVLLSAIESATIDRPCKVLREICTETSHAFQVACDNLLVQETCNDANDAGTKRKRDPTQQRYQIYT